MSTITHTFTGDISNLQRCYQSLGKDVVRLEQQMQKLASAAKHGNDAVNSGFDRQSAAANGMIGQVASLATQWLTVGTAVRVATDAMRHQFAIQDRGLALQKSLARQQAGMAGSLADSTPEQFAKSNAQLQEMQRRTGFSSQVLAVEAYQRALNATGGKEDVARAATEKALSVSRASPESAPAYAAGIAKSMHLLGFDAETAFGNIGQQQTEGALDSLEITARMQPRIDAAAGFNPKYIKEEALFYQRLNAAIQNQTGDTTGERTATAGVTVAEKLAEYFAPPERNAEGKMTWRFGGLTDPNAPHIPGRPVRKYRPLDPEKYATSEQRIEYLQSHPKEARVWAENMGGEKESRAAIMSLILPSIADAMRQEREKARAAGVPEGELPKSPIIDIIKQSKIGMGDDARETSKKLTKNLESGTPAIAAENRQSQVQAEQEFREIQDTYNSKRAEVRKLLSDTFSKLDSLDIAGSAAIHAKKLFVDIFSGGRSAQAARHQIDDADYWVSSEADKKTLAKAKDSLAEIVGPRPKNLFLQERGVSRLTSPEEMRALQAEILKNNRVKSADDLRPFYREAYEDLENRIQRPEGDGVAPDPGRKLPMDNTDTQAQLLERQRDILEKAKRWPSQPITPKDLKGDAQKTFFEVDARRRELERQAGMPERDFRDIEANRVRSFGGGGVAQRRRREQQIEALEQEKEFPKTEAQVRAMSPDELMANISRKTADRYRSISGTFNRHQKKAIEEAGADGTFESPFKSNTKDYREERFNAWHGDALTELLKRVPTQGPSDVREDASASQRVPAEFMGTAKENPQVAETNQLLVQLIHVNEQVLSTLSSFGNRPVTPTPAAANNQRGVHGER